eukprot:3883503-Rhodomonas_salina.1
MLWSLSARALDADGMWALQREEGTAVNDLLKAHAEGTADHHEEREGGHAHEDHDHAALLAAIEAAGAYGGDEGSAGRCLPNARARGCVFACCWGAQRECGERRSVGAVGRVTGRVRAGIDPNDKKAMKKRMKKLEKEDKKRKKVVPPAPSRSQPSTARSLVRCAGSGLRGAVPLAG